MSDKLISTTLGVLVLAFVLVLATKAARPEGAESFAATSNPLPDDSDWRRTEQGWEQMKKWNVVKPYQPWRMARIHPVVIGACELLISLAALIAFSKDEDLSSFMNRRATLRPKA